MLNEPFTAIWKAISRLSINCILRWGFIGRKPRQNGPNLVRLPFTLLLFPSINVFCGACYGIGYIYCHSFLVQELTVVCIRPSIGELTEVFQTLIKCYRTRLLLPSLRSTRRLPSWCPRVAGQSLATRYAIEHEPLRCLRLLILSAGKIRRSLRTIDNNFTTRFPLCTLAL